MARSKKNPSEDKPQDNDKLDRVDENATPSDADQNSYSSDANEIEEIWNSSARMRRYRSESVEPSRQEDSDSAYDDSESADEPSSYRSYRYRPRRSYGDDARWENSDNAGERDDSDAENSDEEGSEGYAGPSRGWSRNSYYERRGGDYRSRYSRDDRDGRDYRGGYNQNRDGQDDDFQDGRRSYRQDNYRQDNYRQDNYRQDGYRQGGYRQGGYRQGYRQNYQQDGYQQGGYRQNYQQDGYQQGGYQNNRFRQERYYRRHFRDTDVRVLRDSDIRGGTEPINTNNGENAVAPENLQPERPYRPYYNNYNRRYTNPGYPNEMLDQMEPEHAPRGKYGEPLSLAEELASERYHNKDAEETPVEIFTPEEIAELDDSEMTGADFVASLQEMDAQQLVKEARKYSAEDETEKKKREACFRVLKEKIKVSGMMYGEGTLEILPEEFGFLRNPEFHYLSCPDDIYISPSQIRRFGLRNGSTVFGQIRPPKEKERYFALLRIESINDDDPNILLNKPLYDELTAMHPNQRIILETPDEDMNTRVVDLIVPVGFGQRGLIVSPPRAGKTVLMQKMARSVLTNYPNAYVFMLLVDERPEEVTDMERQVKGPHCEVISSTFDEPAARHIQVSEMVLDKAKRMVEYGKDVVIFLDSITRLARAWSNEFPTSGKTLSGGVDAGALQPPKKFFGSARKVEEGGSLTILATALVDTGSRMDEVIFEEFKGTGNLEIWLDRSLVDKRIWPAIDISRSGTRREEMILDPDEHKRMTVLRRILNEMNPPDAMEFLTQKLAKTQNNAEFLMSLNLGSY